MSLVPGGGRHGARDGCLRFRPHCLSEPRRHHQGKSSKASLNLPRAILGNWTMKSLAILVNLALATVAAAAGCVSRRPHITPSPYNPRVPIPDPPKRTKWCFVETHGDGVTDDSPYILSAFHECNDGGHVIFNKDSTYIIGTAMDWTFLKHIDIGMTPMTCNSCPIGSLFAVSQCALRMADTAKSWSWIHTTANQGCTQTFKVASYSPMTRITGRRIRSDSSSRMSPRSSNLVEKTYSFTEVSSCTTTSTLREICLGLLAQASTTLLHETSVALCALELLFFLVSG